MYPLQLGVAEPRLAGPNSPFPSPTPLLRSMASTHRGIRTPTSVTNSSTQPAYVQPLHQPEEDPLPRVLVWRSPLCRLARPSCGNAPTTRSSAPHNLVCYC